MACVSAKPIAIIMKGIDPQRTIGQGDRKAPPVGQITQFLSSLLDKNKTLPSSGKSKLQTPPSRPTEGRVMIVAYVGQGMRWTRQRQARERIAGRITP